MKRETTNHAKHTNEGDADLRSPASDLGPQASGARIAMLTAMALTGILAVAVWGEMPSADSEVTHRTGPYRIQNGALDAPDAYDLKVPSQTSFSNGVWTLRRDFTPPPNWSFLPIQGVAPDRLTETRGESDQVWAHWAQRPAWVDIWADVEHELLVEVKSTVNAQEKAGGAGRIEVEAQLLTPQTAAQYPLRCEGNLNPPSGPGGPGGQATTNYWAAIIVGGIELHIDADNNGTPETNWAPDRTPEERAVRNDPSKPGRLIAVNDGDSNTNGVPDFADMQHSNRFVRVELDVTKVADTIDWGTARVRFNYSASDPAQVQTNVTTVGSITVTNYVAQAGFMRLWTKDGLAQRNPASVTEGGDYVPAGVELMATNLFASGTTSLPFYVEGISPATSEYASIAATVRAGPGAPPTLQMEDEVRVTIFKVDLDVDTDRDGTVDDADEEDEDSWTLSRGAFVSVDDAPVISSENIPSLVPVVLRSLNLSSHEGMSASLAVEGNDQIRLMKADGMIVWPAGDQGPCDLAPEIASHELTLYAAATKDLSAFATKASAKTRITLTVRDAGDNSLGSDTVEMQVAPIILAWNSLAMEKLYVTSEFPEDVCAAKQISYEPFPVWTQDYMELGVSGVTANRATDQVTDLHHRYGSTAYVQDMLDDASAGHPHWHRGTWDNGGNGVNIEVYPPYEGHPYGRIVMLPQSDPNCFKKIQAQGIQAPIQVSKYDGWLTVGHIDELFCFLQPAYVLVADPAKAWVEIIDLLNTPSADTQLYVGGCDVSMEDATIDVSSDMNFFFAQTCPLEQYLPLGASTMTVTQGQYEVGDYLLIEREVLKVTGVAQINGVTELTVERGLEFGNSGQSHQPGAKIRKLSEEFAINVYDGQVGFSLYDRIKDMESELKTDLGTSFSTVRVPVVFGIFRNQWGADVGRVAFTANMVNCVVDGHTLYATDPGNSRFRELLRAHVSGQVVFPAGATAWDNYHRWAGEIHCGSNAKRTFPDAAWWSHEAFSNWGE